MDKFPNSEKIPFTLIHAEFSKGEFIEPQIQYNEKTQMIEYNDVQLKTWWKTKTGVLNSDSVHGDH